MIQYYKMKKERDKNMKKLFCIVGETSSGKDTMVTKLIQNLNTLSPVVSYTTRPKRNTETNGIEHYFVSDEYFHKLKNEYPNDILAYTKICSDDNPDGYEYMALKKELDFNNVYIIDPNGVKYLKSKFPEIDLVIIYIYAPLSERRKRASTRNDFEKEFEKRVKNEQGQFDEFCKNRDYDYIIYNTNSLEKSSYTALESIVKYELYLEMIHNTYGSNFLTKKE